MALLVCLGAVVRTTYNQQLDAAAGRSLDLAVSRPPGGYTYLGQLALGLDNRGAQGVRLLSVLVDGPGYRRQHVDEDVPGARTGAPISTTLSLDVTPTCRPALLETGATRLVVEVRTVRGTRRELGLPLPGEARAALRSAGQEQCRLLPPGRSVRMLLLDGSGPKLRRPGLELQLGNRSLLPLTVEAVGAGPGLTVRLDRTPPFALPPVGGPDDVTEATQGVQVALTVGDCGALLRRPRQGLGGLEVTVSRAGATVTLPVATGAAGRVVDRVVRELLAGCRATPRAS